MHEVHLSVIHGHYNYKELIVIKKEDNIELDFTPPKKEIKRGAKGRWQKGQSGNPAGSKKGARKAVTPEVIKLFADNTEKALNRLLYYMSSDDDKIGLDATKFFIEKCLGKTFQAHEDMQTAEGSNEVKINFVMASKREEKEEL